MVGPKEKKERSLGVRLGLKGARCQSPKCAAVRKPYRPGQHGKRRVPPLSDFGRQLKEKQKFKVSYGLDERRLRKTFAEASRKTGSSSAKLIELLERRLDNVLFRGGLGVSRSASRQLVVHGHIFVNGKRVRSPGYVVKVGDVVSVSPSSKEKLFVKSARENLKNYEPPFWLLPDGEKMEIKVSGLPQEESQSFDASLLVESFGKS